MEAQEKKSKAKGNLSSTFKTGAVSLAFMIIGFQVALFVHRTTVVGIISRSAHPDTVYIYKEVPPSGGTLPSGHAQSGAVPAQPRAAAQRNPAGRTVRETRAEATAAKVYERFAGRRYENFPFDPNTVSVEDLCRLGFTEKQAQAIDNYRSKGGRFRRKEDFAKSFVVADSVYRRLEPYITIPRIDINAADSAAFDGLPGIGPYFAARMVSYRESLGGYSFPEQLMDIYNFGEERYRGLSDLIECGPSEPFALWTLPADSLSRHPYIRDRRAARSIVLFRENTPVEQWSVEAIAAAGILPDSTAAKLLRCRIAPADGG